MKINLLIIAICALAGFLTTSANSCVGQMSQFTANALFGLGLDLCDEKGNDDAFRYYSVMIARNPQSTMAYYKRGQVRRALRDYSGAFEDFSQALELDPHCECARKARISLLSTVLQEGIGHDQGAHAELETKFKDDGADEKIEHPMAPATFNPFDPRLKI